MSYTVAAAVGVGTAVLVDLCGLRTRLVLGKLFWLSYAIVLIGQLALNGVLTGLSVVRYDPAAILGPRLVHAPVEDLAFGFALVLTTLATWVWWAPRLSRRRGSES